MIAFAFGDIDLSLEKYLAYCQQERRNSRATVTCYRDMLRKYAEWVRGGGVRDVRAPQLGELENYLAGLCDLRAPQRRLKPRTIALHVVALRGFYRWLALEGRTQVCDIRPVLNLDKPKPDEVLQFVLSHEQMIELLDSPRRGMFRERDKAILEVLYSTGCRVGELVHMRMDDLDMREGKVRATVKGGAERFLLLGRYATSSIIAYLTWGRPKLTKKCPDSPWLFAGRGSLGGPMTRNGVWYMVRRYGDAIGAEGVVAPHTIRRSSATHLIMNDAPLAAVKAFLGHASVKTTQKYLRLDPSRLVEVHERCHPHGAKRQTPVNAADVMRQTTELAVWPEPCTQPDCT